MEKREAAIITGDPYRCECHRLICILKGNAIEIKCPKCKRITTIHTSGIVKIVNS